MRQAAVAFQFGTVALRTLALLLTLPTLAVAQYQPHLSFKVIATEHFRIYFHQGQEPVARRLAGIAESVRSTLPDRVRLAAPPLTHVVLANQDDDANGTATPIPYCTVRLSAVWPALSEFMGNTDDWLRLVFVHEYVHVLQLNQSVGWATVWKAVFGRAPMAFPNLFLPTWQVEGFATYWESRATGLGRLTGGDTAAIVRGRALLPGGEPIDRVNGGSVEWPGGLGPYLEGAWFYEYLARRFGEEAVGRLAMVTAGRFPYLSSPATRRVFGQSLGTLWTDFQQSVHAEASAISDRAQPGRRLTRRGFTVSTPRFDSTGQMLVYSSHDPDRFPALIAIDLATDVTRSIVDRFAGTQVSARSGLVVFDQLDIVDNVAWRSDLFTVDLRNGRSSRLTRDQRLLEPDVSPDGRQLACVRVADDGRRALAFFAIERGTSTGLSLRPVTVSVGSDGQATFGAPRWSPDGRRLAVERRRLHGPSEIVVFDLADGSEHVTASSATSRNIGPAWLPDGRTILFASDRANRSFQIYAASVDGAGLSRVSNVAGGAVSPEVSPDGSTLVYVGSDATGYDLFALPLEQAMRGAVTEAQASTPTTDHGPADAGVPGPAGGAAVQSATLAYSPLPTLLPRAWTPAVDTHNGDLRAGAIVSGEDVLQRHSVSAAVMWRFSETTAVGGPRSGRPDWSAGYAYTRWRPTVYVDASDTTSFLTLASPGTGVPDAELREQDVAVGVRLPIRRVQHQQVWQAEFDVERETRTWTGPVSREYRNAFRAAWTINTAHVYGYSISQEEGVAAAVTSEQVRRGFGADGNADAFTTELRAYLRPGRGHSVFAARAGYGIATGDRNVRRQFFVGGTSAAGNLVNFGTDAIGMVRGFDEEVASGNHVAAVSVEWRQPLWRLERGKGTWPLYLKTIHAAVFADAGNAWVDSFSIDRVRTSVGIEGSIATIIGYRFPLTLAAGVARTRDGLTGRSATGVYIRFGPSF